MNLVLFFSNLSLIMLLNKNKITKSVYTVFKESGKSLMSRYTIAKIIKEIKTPENLNVYTIVDHYNENFQIWRTHSDMPCLHGANSFDIFIIDEEYSKKYTNNGHCKEYDMFRLEENWVYISDYILSEVRKSVTPRDFENLMVELYKQIVRSAQGYSILNDHKHSNRYYKITFDTDYDKMQYDLEYTNSDIYKEIRKYFPRNIKELVNG